jgi:hypothetical protein
LDFSQLIDSGRGRGWVPGNLFLRFEMSIVRALSPVGELKRCDRFELPDSGEPDAYAPEAEELGLGEVPTDTLSFVLPSR